ncbi:gamma-butyrobetaine hydroxylase-like domain-containing protein [Hydrocarboniclastica marina]|uniref:DUF971 domain-containing protein n=1 Tax=Hydrocarboniclastica marina TaxID=2259620 RepID=A0A4P7XES9_9ALTE|nr:DUF971 domain-containing protein [Hydrocarboniclastica marina]MAL99526.1 1-(5-phosphoribosyl)-5-((5-phosphoribosylamino)methylideneamino)imidazole-4-carboxamide isomerase [Alteromonadaceae bacterium]QCF25063.1 DUF971 domain-containing protein [Hydrocarboniclastica marina]
MTRDKVPGAIRIRRASRCLELQYADATTVSLPFEYLRVYSPSAEVRGHGGGEGYLVAGKADVQVTGAEAVGNYALKLGFDDGHDSGLFTWEYLKVLAREQEQRWEHYLKRLEAAGQSRRPAASGSPQPYPAK